MTDEPGATVTGGGAARSPAAGAGSEPISATMTIALTAILTGAIVSALILQTSPTLSPNDTSRWNAVWAMVETGRCSWVGDKPWWTIDRCTFDPIDTPADGKKARWYSSKPYFLQVVLAGIAWPFCRWGGLDFQEHIGVVGRIILILVNAVPLSLLIVLFGRFMLRQGVRGFAFVFSLLAAAGGTYLTAWCVTLNNHLPAAYCVFFMMYALWVAATRPRAGWAWYAAIGLFGGLAFAFEVQAAAVLGLCGLFLAHRWWHERDRAILAYVSAAALPILAFFVTNHLCTGLWLPFQWTFPRFYDPYWLRPTGLDALREPKPLYLFHLTLGHHGFISLTPVFLVGLVGIARHLGDRSDALRPIAAVILVGSLAVIAFETIMTHNYGGTCEGPRWLFWLIPMWLLMLPSGAERLARSAGGRVVAVLVLAVSMFSTAYASRMPWSRSWLHELFALAGLVDY